MTQTWDEEAKAKAIIAALDAAMPVGVHVSDEDELPAEPAARPERFVTVEIERQFTESRLASGEVPVPGGSVWLHYGARTVTNVRVLRKLATAALEDVALPLPGGDHVGPFTFQTALRLESPAGWFEAADDFRF